MKPAVFSERGYTMALALAIITVMGLALMVALPRMSKIVQREQELTLIYRGESIANAIREYQLRMGKYPSDLEDLMKIRPRLLRQIYNDPITNGPWELIHAGQPNASQSSAGLPIIGVRSFSERDSVVVYQNRSLIHDWIFTADNNLINVGPPTN